MTVVAFQHVAGRVHLVDEVTGRTVGIGKLIVPLDDAPSPGAAVGDPVRVALTFEGSVGPFPWPDTDAVPAAEPLTDPPAPASPAQPDVTPEQPKAKAKPRARSSRT